MKYNVAALRKERRLTKTALAKALGVSVVYIRDVELGSRNLTAESLEQLADFFGVPVNDLINSEERA